MWPLLSFIFLSCLVNIGLVKCGSKYSENANTHTNRKFQAQKVNLLYEKAERLLHSADLDKLWTDLKAVDKYYMSAKYDHHDGKDTHGEGLKDVEKKLAQISAKYGISEVFESFNGQKLKKDKPAEADNVAAGEYFRDKKLHKLWRKAMDMPFSGEELSALRTELQHYQKKLDEYESQLGNLDHHENAVHSELDEDKKVAKSNLKKINREINDGIEKISKRVLSGDKFKHKRVKFLWQQALSLDMAPKELNELEEELRHFDAKLEKLNHIKSTSQDFGSKDVDDLGAFDKNSPTLEKYAQGVNKFEKYLQSKITHVDL